MKSVINPLTAVSNANEDFQGNMLQVNSNTPVCSFSGKPAEFYIGLSGPGYNEGVRLLGAISSEFVERAIVNVLGKGVGEIQWPVILDLSKRIYYHSYYAYTKGLSATMGWNELLKKTKVG